jgi:hypothetical protein
MIAPNHDRLGSLRFLVITGMATLATMLAGCASSSSGTKIDQSNVDRIQKGVTTRTQMEQMFGTPDNITIMGDGSGRRMATWNHIESDAHVKGTSFIPVVGMFAGGTEGTTTHESLQATYREDVVEDYQYSSGGQNTDVTNGPFGSTAHSSANGDTSNK